MSEEVNHMINALESNEYFIKEFHELECKLDKMRELLKGKVVFGFLKYYLKHKGGCEALFCCSEEYANVVHSIEVKLEIKMNH